MSIRRDAIIKKIIAETAQETGLDESTVYDILDNEFRCAAEAIKNGDDIRLPHFGSFKIKTKKRTMLKLEAKLKEEGKSDEEIKEIKKEVSRTMITPKERPIRTVVLRKK